MRMRSQLQIIYKIKFPNEGIMRYIISEIILYSSIELSNSDIFFYILVVVSIISPF